MLSAASIYTQLTKITGDLIELSLCNQQNYPSIKEYGYNCYDISISGYESISYTLKNVPYFEIYSELDRTQSYNFKMLDGALIQMMYRFQENKLETHRLAFFSSPLLEEFQNNPSIYLEDDVYADVIARNIVPFPLRFDFDCREGVAVDIMHPKSHLTLGQYKNCRIPVSSPITPYHFISFILRNFYNTAFHKYHDKITSFNDIFDNTITEQELNLVHVQVNMS